MTSDIIYILLGVIACVITWIVATLNGQAALKHAQAVNADTDAKKSQANLADHEARLKSNADMDAEMKISTRLARDQDAKILELTVELREAKKNVEDLKEALYQNRVQANENEKIEDLNSMIEELKKDRDGMNLDSKKVGIENDNLKQEALRLNTTINDLRKENDKLKTDLSRANLQHLEDYKLNLNLAASCGPLEWTSRNENGITTYTLPSQGKVTEIAQAARV